MLFHKNRLSKNSQRIFWVKVVFFKHHKKVPVIPFLLPESQVAQFVEHVLPVFFADLMLAGSCLLHSSRFDEGLPCQDKLEDPIESTTNESLFSSEAH